MAIHQTKKQTDLEKRLQLLRQQVYGKSSEHSENNETADDRTASQKVRKSESQTFRYTDTPISSSSLSHSESFRSDITYLRQDLMKISILAGTALGIQIILYFLLKNNILNINLF